MSSSIGRAKAGRYEQLDQLLWTTSVLSRKTPVLVIAERYRIDQATMMYRMGVSEYISRTHHLEQLGQVFGAYLHPVTLATAQVVSSTQQPVCKGVGNKSFGRVPNGTGRLSSWPAPGDYG